jgi:hypothetical protein
MMWEVFWSILGGSVGGAVLGFLVRMRYWERADHRATKKDLREDEQHVRDAAKHVHESFGTALGQLKAALEAADHEKQSLRALRELDQQAHAKSREEIVRELRLLLAEGREHRLLLAEGKEQGANSIASLGLIARLAFVSTLGSIAQARMAMQRSRAMIDEMNRQVEALEIEFEKKHGFAVGELETGKHEVSPAVRADIDRILAVSAAMRSAFEAVVDLVTFTNFVPQAFGRATSDTDDTTAQVLTASLSSFFAAQKFFAPTVPYFEIASKVIEGAETLSSSRRELSGVRE